MIIRCLAFLALAFTLGCAHTNGTFQASGPSLGQWTMESHRCFDGNRYGFLGTDIIGGSLRAPPERYVAETKLPLVRLVRDAVAGDRVRVYAPGGTGQFVDFTAAACRTWEAKTEREVGGSRFVTTVTIEGRVALDCSDALGNRFAGEAELVDCD
jgi:hypothetical protein